MDKYRIRKDHILILTATAVTYKTTDLIGYLILCNFINEYICGSSGFINVSWYFVDGNSYELVKEIKNFDLSKNAFDR